MKTHKEFFASIRKLIAKDDLVSALQQLQTLLGHSPEMDEIIQQSGRFHAIRKQIRLGIVSHEEANLTQNKIRIGLLDLLSEMETHSEEELISKELEKAIGIVKRAFNEQLTKALIEAIAPHCIPGRKFSERVAVIPNWEQQERISSKAKEIIAYSFVGVIGIQLSKLMAIGKESFSEDKQRKYIQKCLEIVKRSLDLVNFALLSGLWDTQQDSPCEISDLQNTVLSRRLDSTFGQSIMEQFELLQALHGILASNQRAFPVSELAGFKKHLQIDSDFHKVFQAFESLNQRLDKDEYSLVDCFDAETQLAAFFQHFAFLVNYSMVSIKQIGYQQIRNATPSYLHRYAALGIDNKANVDAEKINYSQETSHTDAILLYKGDHYKDSINLFPFVIDYNALTFEHGAKICFYANKNLEDDSLDYLFLEDNSTVNIEMKDILTPDTDFNTLMMDNEKRTILNLDNVVAGFREARRSILKEEVNFDDL